MKRGARASTGGVYADCYATKKSTNQPNRLEFDLRTAETNIVVLGSNLGFFTAVLSVCGLAND